MENEAGDEDGADVTFELLARVLGATDEPPSLVSALEQAKVWMFVAALDGSDLPELRVSADVDPAALVLVTPPT